MHELQNWVAASLIAAVLAASSLLDGPTEAQAVQDVAAEVVYLAGGAQ